MTIISLLIAVIIIGVVYWCLTKLIAAFSIPDPLATVIIVIFVLLVLAALFGQYTGRINLRLF